MTLSGNSSSKALDKTDEYHQDRVKEIRPESLLCRLKYHNSLPELPFDPKFLVYPLEPSRFLQYIATSLERNYKHELLAETDVGVEVDLIDPDAFRIDKSAKLHPDDELLLEDDTSSAINARKSRHQKSVSWLRRTEYISTEMFNRWNKSDKVESKLGYNAKRLLNEEIVYRDRESQINAIEATFEASKKPITKHYSKPNVHAVEVLPVLPDFTLWRYPCAQVIFDDDPSQKNKTVAEQKEEVNQAMIRGMVDESGDHFVAYFLPTENTKQLRRLDNEQRIPYTEGAAYEYELAREYNWNVKNKTMANYEENYFFVFRQDGVYYNELETRVRLSKRRKLTQSGSFAAGGGGAVAQVPKTRLIVHHRDFTDDELKAQTDRLYMLEHDLEEEEEEEGGDGSRGEEDQRNEDENEEGKASGLVDFGDDDDDGEEEEGSEEHEEEESEQSNDPKEAPEEEDTASEDNRNDSPPQPHRRGHRTDAKTTRQAKGRPTPPKRQKRQSVMEIGSEEEEEEAMATATSSASVSPVRPLASGRQSNAGAKSRANPRQRTSSDETTEATTLAHPVSTSSRRSSKTDQRVSGGRRSVANVFDDDEDDSEVGGDEEYGDLSDLSD